MIFDDRRTNLFLGYTFHWTNIWSDELVVSQILPDTICGGVLIFLQTLQDAFISGCDEVSMRWGAYGLGSDELFSAMFY